MEQWDSEGGNEPTWSAEGDELKPADPLEGFYCSSDDLATESSDLSSSKKVLTAVAVLVAVPLLAGAVAPNWIIPAYKPATQAPTVPAVRMSPPPASAAVATVLKQTSTTPGRATLSPVNPPGLRSCRNMPRLRHVQVGGYAHTDKLSWGMDVMAPGLGSSFFSAYKKAVKGCGWSANPRLGTDSVSTHNYTAARLGDVLMFATGKGHLAKVRSMVQAASSGPLDGCKDLKSSLPDSSRSPFSYKFTGLQKEKLTKIEVSSPPLKPRPSEVFASVERPPAPSYPHSPAQLPAEVQMPTSPTPPARPSTVTTYKVRVPDPVGPGCGWAFTASTPAPYDPEQVKKDNEGSRLEARGKLRNRWDGYVDRVSEYNTAVGQFYEDADSYQEYSDEVDRVLKNWDDQGVQYDDYLARLRVFEARSKARSDFLREQRLAQRRYDDQVEECTKMPTKDPEFDFYCPPVKDPVLSQDPPAIGMRPTFTPQERW